jgi:hypothetical protein
MADLKTLPFTSFTYLSSDSGSYLLFPAVRRHGRRRRHEDGAQITSIAIELVDRAENWSGYGYATPSSLNIGLVSEEFDALREYLVKRAPNDALFAFEFKVDGEEVTEFSSPVSRRPSEVRQLNPDPDGGATTVAGAKK